MYEKLGAILPEVAEQFTRHLDENVDLVRHYPEIIQKKVEALERLSAPTQVGEKVE
jgi:hypothetical protein